MVLKIKARVAHERGTKDILWSQRTGGPKKGHKSKKLCDFTGFCFMQAGDQNRF